MLPIWLDDGEIDDLFSAAPSILATSSPPTWKAKVTDDFGLSLPIEVQEFRRHRLFHGLDDIGLTLRPRR